MDSSEEHGISAESVMANSQEGYLSRGWVPLRSGKISEESRMATSQEAYLSRGWIPLRSVEPQQRHSWEFVNSVGMLRSSVQLSKKE